MRQVNNLKSSLENFVRTSVPEYSVWCRWAVISDSQINYFLYLFLNQKDSQNSLKLTIKIPLLEIK